MFYQRRAFDSVVPEYFSIEDDPVFPGFSWIARFLGRGFGITNAEFFFTPRSPRLQGAALSPISAECSTDFNAEEPHTG